MKIGRNKLFKWIKIIIIIYCSIGIALYYLQERLLFHPKRLETNHVFNFDQAFEELSIAVNTEDTISLVRFLPGQPVKKGIVIYYHGNRENVEHYAHFAKMFTSAGYEVWMQDYPGFGKSRGARTEQKMYDQAVQVYKMAAGKTAPDSIIIYGKSLGTGIATYVASLVPCKRLVLETPYYSIPDLLNSFSLVYPTAYMSEYKIPTWNYLQDVTEPVTIFHGTKDGITFYNRAKKLKTYLKAGDEFITIDGGKHNDLPSSPVFKNKMNQILQQ